MKPRGHMRRPALIAAVAFAAGILLDDAWPQSPVVWMVAAACAWMFAAWLMRRRDDWALTICLLLTVAAAGALRHHEHTRLSPPDHVRQLEGEGVGVLSGSVHGEPVRTGEGDRRRLRLRLQAESWWPQGGELVPLSGLVQLTLRDVDLVVDDADQLQVRARLRRPAQARNPGAFDYRRFLALQGVHAVATVPTGGVVRLQPRPGAEQGAIAALRQVARATLTSHMSGPPAGLLRGMLLGDRQFIPADVFEQFRNTGLAHALVISGLHVGLIALFFFSGFRLLRLPVPACYLLTTMVLVCYAFVTGLQAPVVRSAVMAGVVMLGRAVGRRSDVCNGIGLAALIILSVSPASLLTLSFQLSFGATFAIVWLHGPLKACVPARWADEECFVGRWIISPLCVSVAAQLGTGPLIAWHFGQLAPVSLPANLFVVPLLGLAVALGLLTVLTGAIWTAAALPFAASNYLALTALLWLVDQFHRVPPVVTARPDALFLCMFALVLCLGVRAASCRRARVWLLLGLLAWANLALWPPLLRPPRLEVVFLDVGQGDGAFVQLPHGGTMIIDAGMRTRTMDAGQRTVVPFLRHRGIGRVDVVVASHPHSDHIGGLLHLLQNVEVGHYVDSGQRYDTWTARRIHELIRDRGITYHRVAAGDSLAGLGGAGGLVLHPTRAFVGTDGGSPEGLNNGSVVLRLDFGGRRVLFTGDIEAETEPAMRAWGARLRADVLKAAHHGSRTSSGEAFLDQVDASAAVVSVGNGNRFGHPAAEVLQRLGARGMSIFRTDRCGAVTLQIAGDGRFGTQPLLSACGSGR